MNNHRLKLLLLMVSVIITPFAQAGNTSGKISEFQLTVNQDGTFNVTTKETSLGLLLTKISEKTGVEIYVDNTSKNRPVSIDANGITLVQLLQRLAVSNYTMVFDRHGSVEALHVVQQNEPQPTARDVNFSDFSGQVKISNNRARMFFMPADNSKYSVDNYIKERHALLAKLAAQDPFQQTQAQISFQGYMSADQIAALIKENQLDPVTLNIGWKENGGGYDLKRGESLEAAIESAALHYQRLIAQLRDDADMQVAQLRQQGVSESQIRSALAFQQNAKELDSIFLDKGVPFYGVRVAANAKQLHSLTGDILEVRLVDPLWCGSVEDEISKAYPTTKIAIPLVPDNNNFIP